MEHKAITKLPYIREYISCYYISASLLFMNSLRDVSN